MRTQLVLLLAVVVFFASHAQAITGTGPKTGEDSIGAYNYLGCYHGFTGNTYYDPIDSSSIVTYPNNEIFDSCRQRCKGKTELFALYNSGCFCPEKTTNKGKPVDDSYCELYHEAVGKTCNDPSSPDYLCGGTSQNSFQGYIAVYSYTLPAGYTPPPTTTKPAVTSTPTTATVTTSTPTTATVTTSTPTTATVTTSTPTTATVTTSTPTTATVPTTSTVTTRVPTIAASTSAPTTSVAPSSNPQQPCKRGPTGCTGVNNPVGVNNPYGPDNKTGADNATGKTNVTGKTAVTGKTNKTGKNNVTGKTKKTGKTVRDVIEVEQI